MKTNTSVEGNLLGEGDHALQGYHPHRRKEQVLKRLERVYTHQLNSDEKHTATRLKAKFRSTIKERW